MRAAILKHMPTLPKQPIPRTNTLAEVFQRTGTLERSRVPHDFQRRLLDDEWMLVVPLDLGAFPGFQRFARFFILQLPLPRADELTLLPAHVHLYLSAVEPLGSGPSLQDGETSFLALRLLVGVLFIPAQNRP